MAHIINYFSYYYHQANQDHVTATATVAAVVAAVVVLSAIKQLSRSVACDKGELSHSENDWTWQSFVKTIHHMELGIARNSLHNDETMPGF